MSDSSRRSRRRSGGSSTSNRGDPGPGAVRTVSVDVHALAVPRTQPREWGARAASPWVVAAVVAVTYAVLLGPGLAHNPSDYANIGRKFLHHGTTSTVIKPSLPTNGKVGYDGQFYYFLALDPRHGKDYIEQPGFIYSRIGYPMTVRALSGGNAALIPYMMVLVNIAAAVGGTLAVAFMLKRRGLPPLLALVYGFFPGLMLAVLRDLTEPMAFALAAAGLAVFHPRSKWRLLGSASLFGFAMLTRETVALFPAILALGLLVGTGSGVPWRRRLRVGNLARATTFAVISFVPLLAWRHILTAYWLHNAATQEHFASGTSYVAGGTAGTFASALVPFHAIAGQWPWTGEDVTDLLTIFVPALVWAAMAALVLRRKLSLEPWFVLGNVAVFVVFLPTPIAVDYGSLGRAAIAIVLSVLVMLARVTELFPSGNQAVLRTLALWSLPYYLVWAILLNALGPKLIW